MTLPYLNTRNRAKRPAFDGYWRYDGFSFVHFYSLGFCAQGFCGGLVARVSTRTRGFVGRVISPQKNFGSF